MIFDTYIRCDKTTNLEAIRSSVNHQNSSFLHLHRSLIRLMKSLIPYLLFIFLILCPIMHTNSWWWGGQWPWGHGQYPWGIGGPWACCSRVRVQSSGFTTSWQPGTYLHTLPNCYFLRAKS